jgi:flavodoxin
MYFFKGGNRMILVVLIIFTVTVFSEEGTGNEIDFPNREQNILIAYFTWADNTFVENPDLVNVDVYTGASLIAPGDTARLAQMIHEFTGGETFSIQTVVLYPNEYGRCVSIAADEKAQNIRPELKTHIDNMEDYDIIYLGYPIWWYTVPMGVFTFMEEYDLSGKTIVPYCSHGGGGLLSSVRDITAALPDSTILAPFSVYQHFNYKNTKEDVESWLKKIGMIE